MNVRFQHAVHFLPSLLAALAGWGGLHAQTNAPNWPPPSPAGPYALGYDPEDGRVAIDEPIPGFIGPAGDGVAPYGSQNLQQYVNPVFVEWASTVANYSPARPELIESCYVDPSVALGTISGNVFDVVSLGDLSALDIAEGLAPGTITLSFDAPIGDGSGPDFAVFGNAFNLRGRTLQVFSKLAFVEVSSDGVNFARFPSVDTNPKPAQSTWPYMVANPTLIYNLFGKAINGYGYSWGVPFDLADLRQHPLVAAGLLDLQNVRYVRLVAVVGDGRHSSDAYGHPIYDPWPTTGSPGPEVQAIGVLNIGTSPDSANASAASANFSNNGGRNSPVAAAGVKVNHRADPGAQLVPVVLYADATGGAFLQPDAAGFASTDAALPVQHSAGASIDDPQAMDAPLGTTPAPPSSLAASILNRADAIATRISASFDHLTNRPSGGAGGAVAPEANLPMARNMAAATPLKAQPLAFARRGIGLALLVLGVSGIFVWRKRSTR